MNIKDLQNKIQEIMNKESANILLAKMIFTKGMMIVQIGTYGVSINVIKYGKVIDEKFLPASENMSAEAKEFVAQHKNNRVAIIVDVAESNVNNAAIPVAQGFMTERSVMEYINKTFDKNDLVAYKVHNVAEGENQVLHVCFSTVTPNQLITEWVEYSSTNCAAFQGVYFTNLLVPKIIDRLLTPEQKSQHPLRILVTVSGSAGIRIVVAHGNNVMVSKVVEYPTDKSNEYIQGVIEQEVVDRLIGLKDYVYHKQLKPLIVLLAPPELEQLLQNSTFEASEKLKADKLVFAAPLPLSNQAFLMDQKIATMVADKFDNVATSLEFRNYFWVVKIKDLYLKPLWLIVAFLFALLGYNLLQGHLKKADAHAINNKYYDLSERYRDIKKQYPDIDDIEQLISYKAAEDEINTTQILPFDLINKVIDKLPENIKIDRIIWNLYSGNVDFLVNNTDENKLDDTSISDKWYKNEDLSPQIDPKLEFYLEYASSQSNEDNILQAVKNDLVNLDRSIQGYKLNIIKDVSASTRGGGNKVYFPIKLTISKE